MAQGKNHKVEVGLRDTVLMGKDLVPVMELHRGARAGYSDPQRAWSVDHNFYHSPILFTFIHHDCAKLIGIHCDLKIGKDYNLRQNSVPNNLTILLII